MVSFKVCIYTQKGKIFLLHTCSWTFTNMIPSILLYAVGQPFAAFSATKGCSSMTGTLRGSLLRTILSATVAYVFLIAKISKENPFSVVYITKCPAMAP